MHHVYILRSPRKRAEKGQPREWAYAQLGEKRCVCFERRMLKRRSELYDMKDARFREISVAKDTRDEEARAARVEPQAAPDQLNPAGPTTADGKPTRAGRKSRRTTSP
jgi:hypothetical protein